MGWPKALIPNRFWLKEFTIAVLVLAIYSATNLNTVSRDRALGNSLKLIEFERSSGIFIELDVQNVVLGTALVPVVIYLYALIHPLLTVGFIVLLFLSGNRQYVVTRNLFAVFSLLCFSIFVAYPSAPPRMMSEFGFVDLLHEEAPVSYESEMAKGIFNPYAAMPSVHFGYSLIVGVTLLIRFRDALLRLVGVLYPSMMAIAVVASANHLIVDCLASTVLLGATYVIVVRLEVPDRLARFFKSRLLHSTATLRP